MASVPTVIWVMAVVAGLGQFAAVQMIGPALARGPLSPMWCALNLGFIITISYAHFHLGEHLPRFACVGILAAVACVLAAAWKPPSTSSGEAVAAPSLGVRLTYGGILLGMLIGNSLWFAGVKDLSARFLPDGRSYLDAFGNQFAVGVYLVLGLGSLAELIRTRRTLGPGKPWLLCGGLAAAGSVFGFQALNACASLPASVVLTINNVVSLLSAALISVAIFGERRSPSWYATVGLAVAAVVLVNVGR